MRSPDGGRKGGKTITNVSFDIRRDSVLHTDDVTSSIHSLIVTEQSEAALDLLFQFEHNTFIVYSVRLGPRVIIVQGCGADSDRLVFALGMHTRTQFLFPPLPGKVWEGDKVLPCSPALVFSRLNSIV